MKVVDLPRIHAALAVLDRLAGAVRPVGLGEIEAMTQEASVKATSVRLTAAQEAELERLALELQRLRPDLATLARGGELSPYTVLRLAIDRGLRALADDVDAARRGAP